MTLSRQLILLVVTLVMLLFIGSFLISTQNARGYLSEQLASHAKDAATSLGLSATSHLADNDSVMVQSMTDAMFDSGDYLQIRVENLQGEAWVDRETALKVPDVPDWFIDMVPLETPEGSATVMSGWKQLGKVKVRSHPGYAYQQLWDTMKESFFWFVFGSLALLLLALAALRMLLKPLKQVERQAEAISNREFPIVEQRPATLEFRRVVDAMNRLSRKVKQMLADSEKTVNRLHEQAHQDPVTGLANRRQFMDVLNHRIDDPESFDSGALLLLQLMNFKSYNQEYGFQAGDILLNETAKLIKDTVGEGTHATLSHLSGADFAILVQDVSSRQADALAQRLAEALSGLYSYLQLPSANVGHVGAVYYRGQTATALLGEADLALRQAQKTDANHWVFIDESTGQYAARGATTWHDLLLNAMNQDELMLQRQPVYSCTDKSLLHHEVFLRLKNPEHPAQFINAGVFVPMAESTGLSPRLDQWVIQKVLSELATEQGSIAVNISPASLSDNAMLPWLTQLLQTSRDAASRLILEFPEYGATASVDELHAWVKQLSDFGVRFSLDHFGQGFSSFSYLQKLKAHVVKIDGSFVRELDSSSDNQFYIETLSKIAHGLDMQIVAESVETEAVWEALKKLGVDGGRGYWLGRPV